MNGVHLSSDAKAILDLAKQDGATAAARANVWNRVSTAAGVAAAGGAAVGIGSVSGAGAVTGGIGAAKMFVMGTLLGAVVSVGAAATVLCVRHASSPVEGAAERVTTEPALAAAARGAAISSAPAAPEEALAETLVESNPALSPGVLAPYGVESASAAGPTPAPTPPRVRPSVVRGAGRPPALPGDTLAREATYVSTARSALAGGDAHAALDAIREARGLSSRQLGPEELAVEAQALHALGRESEAREADLALKAQFPESALAR